MVLDNGRGTGDFGAIGRVAMISVHTSPLARLGEKDAGGLNVYVRELSRQLGRLGVAVDIFTRRTATELETVIPFDENVRVVHITAGPVGPATRDELFAALPVFASEMALFALSEGIAYDLVHAHYWLSGRAAHLVRRFWNVPSIVMFHTLAHLKQDAALGAPDGRESEHRIAIEREVMGQVDAIIAANAQERAAMIWRYGVDANKVATIGCGIDLDRFQPRDRLDARQQLGLGEGPLLLFVGRIDPVKGIEFLLDGMAELLARWSGPVMPRLALIGGDALRTPSGTELGPDLARVRRLAAARGIADQLLFLGPKEHDELPLYYAAANAVVVPSRYESFGLVAVEALACGTPVVASRVGGLGFTIEEGRNGFLVDYGDVDALAASINHILLDEPLAARLARGARATAIRHGWPGITRQMLDLYRRVTMGRVRGRGAGAAVCAGG